MSSLEKNPKLSKVDIDLQLPLMINFDSYSPHDFHSNVEIQSLLTDKAFSARHFNIRSLSKNFDSFHHLLGELNNSFQVIGLSETRIKVNLPPLVNTSIAGFDFISQPTLSEAGGVGFYIRNNLSYTKRDEFCCSKPEFESLWIEIETPHQHNIVCGIIYRHPNGNIETTLNFVYHIVEKLSNERKNIIFNL